MNDVSGIIAKEESRSGEHTVKPALETLEDVLHQTFIVRIAGGGFYGAAESERLLQGGYIGLICFTQLDITGEPGVGDLEAHQSLTRIGSSTGAAGCLLVEGRNFHRSTPKPT